jgi:hypothetical protein
VLSARGSYRLIFQLLSLFSVILYYVESGLVVLKTVETTPPKQTLKHNFIWNTHSIVEESSFQRASSAIAKILGTLSDDAISSVNLWDLLLSALSLCIWAYLQDVSTHSILRTIGLARGATADDSIIPSGLPITTNSFKSEEHSSPAPTDENTTTTKKRRGRPRKIPTTASEPTDTSEQTKTPTRPSRKRPTAPADAADTEYTPPPQTRDQVAELETLLGGTGASAEQNSGAGALAWVLFLVGGLGTAVGAVLGGDVSGG